MNFDYFNCFRIRFCGGKIMIFKKAMAGLLAAGTILSLTACNGGTSSSTTNSNTSSGSASQGGNDSKDSDTSVETSTGEKLTLNVLTHRTDRLEDGSLAEMTKAFEEANNTLALKLFCASCTFCYTTDGTVSDHALYRRTVAIT